MKKHHLTALFAVAGLLVLGAAGRVKAGPVTLKDAFKDDFLIGVSINPSQFNDQDVRGDPIIKAQFNSITPENALKWGIRPSAVEQV